MKDYVKDEAKQKNRLAYSFDDLFFHSFDD